MDWQTILLSIISIVLTALISWAAERLIAFINSKISNSKYAKYLTDAVAVITRAVKTTYQTYVQSLKDKDMFTAEAQKEALTMAKDMTLKQLSTDVKQYITDNFGDIETWLNGKIESIIYDLKNKVTGETKSENA